MYIRAIVSSKKQRIVKKLSAVRRELNYVEISQFVAVTDDPQFCLGTAVLYIDTCSNSRFSRPIL